MRLDGSAVVGADIDVDAKHFAARDFRIEFLARLNSFTHIQHGQQGGAEDERAAVGDAGFDDEIGLDLPDQFLHGDHVNGRLDNWPTHAFKVIHVSILERLNHPVMRKLMP